MISARKFCFNKMSRDIDAQLEAIPDQITYKLTIPQGDSMGLSAVRFVSIWFSGLGEVLFLKIRFFRIFCVQSDTIQTKWPPAAIFKLSRLYPTAACLTRGPFIAMSVWARGPFH